jgi:hypothetical protein
MNALRRRAPGPLLFFQTIETTWSRDLDRRSEGATPSQSKRGRLADSRDPPAIDNAFDGKGTCLAHRTRGSHFGSTP